MSRAKEAHERVDELMGQMKEQMRIAGEWLEKAFPGKGKGKIWSVPLASCRSIAEMNPVSIK